MKRLLIPALALVMGAASLTPALAQDVQATGKTTTKKANEITADLNKQQTGVAGATSGTADVNTDTSVGVNTTAPGTGTVTGNVDATTNTTLDGSVATDGTTTTGTANTNSNSGVDATTDGTGVTAPAVPPVPTPVVPTLPVQ